MFGQTKIRNMRYFVIVLSAFMLFASCAKDEEISTREIQQKILEAYIQQNYPEATQTTSGLVIISQEAGYGKNPKQYGAAYLRYSSKELDGTYLTTTYKDLAEQLGTYSADIYYGPELMTLGYGSTITGLAEALKMMNKGSKMTVIVPPWLSNYDSDYDGYYGSSVETQTQSTSVIYELELGDVVDNITEFQIDSLESYRDIYYPGLDSTVYGYYFKKLEGTVTDTVEAEQVVKVYYVGRLLDGYIFDTNIEDTAKKYRIYDSETTYEPHEVTMKSTYTAMTSTGTSDSSTEGYVEGFARAVKSMTYGDRAVTFFQSSLGYGELGTMSSGVGVPDYAMLRFDLYVLPEDE